MKTLSICGHKITLKEGVRYIATRPIADGRDLYDVKIRTCSGETKMVVSGLTYEESNVFLSEFNNGEVSFDGRIW